MLNQTQIKYSGLRVHDYDSGGIWLRGGRKKVTRPLYHKNLYISQRVNNSLGIHYKTWGPDLIRYIPGDKAVICLPDSFNYPSSRQVLMLYSNLAGLYTRKGKTYLLQDTDSYTPSRRVKCPKCRGKGVHWYQCNGLKEDTRKKTGPYRRFMGREVKSFSGATTWVYECTCLNTNPNLDPTNHRASFRCTFCNGNGDRELGNKRISYVWNGDPLVIDLTTGRIQFVYNSQGQLVDIVNDKGGL